MKIYKKKVRVFLLLSAIFLSETRIIPLKYVTNAIEEDNIYLDVI